jgi:transcriptional regulator with XRE-family HTH domain
MNNIAANIEAIRKREGIKQEVLAEKLGVTQGTYSGYLTQNQDIKYGLLLEIANKLNVPIVDIITYPDTYVLDSKDCVECKEKDKIIKHLNEYIEMLTKKKDK